MPVVRNPVPSQNAATPPDAPTPVEASARWAVLLLFWAGAKWLVVATLFGLLASLKLHAPNLMADLPWLTYGRLQPAFWHALIYGFAWPGGLGATLWVLVRLGKTPLAYSTAAIAGGLLWNLGLVIGLLGILAGHGNGHLWLEIPGYASPILIVAYFLLAISALTTFSRRQTPDLQPSQWFLLAALFWFPWIFSSAALLLVAFPVRGVMQAVVAWWYGSQLLWGCVAFLGLGLSWYLIPMLLRRPLHSRYHALFAFWLLVLFTGWRGIPQSAPVPAWMPGVSTVFAVLSLVPWLAVAINFHHTLVGSYSTLLRQRSLTLAAFGAAAYLGASALGILQQLPVISQVTDLTFFQPGIEALMIYGFLGATLLSVSYHVVPRLVPGVFGAKTTLPLPMTLYLAGVLLHALPLVMGGVAQGQAFGSPQGTFMDAFGPALMALRISTLGDLLLVAAALAYAVSFGRGLARACNQSCHPVLVAMLKPEPAEARP